MFKIEIGPNVSLEVLSLRHGKVQFVVDVDHSLVSRPVRLSFFDDDLEGFRKRLWEFEQEGFNIPTWLHWLAACAVILENGDDREDQLLWQFTQIVKLRAIPQKVDWPINLGYSALDVASPDGVMEMVRIAMIEDRITLKQFHDLIEAFDKHYEIAASKIEGRNP